MNVLITNADGTTTNPVYSPEHKDDVIRFYKELIGNRKIGRVVITMDNGDVINLQKYPESWRGNTPDGGAPCYQPVIKKFRSIGVSFR